MGLGAKGSEVKATEEGLTWPSTGQLPDTTRGLDREILPTELSARNAPETPGTELGV